MGNDPDAKGVTLWIILYLIAIVAGVVGLLFWRGIW